MEFTGKEYKEDDKEFLPFKNEQLQIASELPNAPKRTNFKVDMDSR